MYINCIHITGLPPKANQQTYRNTGKFVDSDRLEFEKIKTYLEIRKVGEDVFITL